MTYLMPLGSGTYCPILKSGGREVASPAAQASQVKWNTILFEFTFPLNHRSFRIVNYRISLQVAE